MFFDKKAGTGASKNEDVCATKVYARFKSNISAADLAETSSLFHFYRGVKYLLCVIDVFTKKIKR